MNCEKYNNMIPEYISGELEEHATTEFEAHIKECTDCRVNLETEKAVLAMTAEDGYDVPEGLNSIILSKLPVKKPAFRINFMRYAVAASFFFLVIMSYFMFNPSVMNNSGSEFTFKTYSVLRPAALYTNDYLIGSDYDELITYKTELYDENKWTSDDTDIFQSEDDLINDLLTLEELESYDSYLSSL
ncbi:MAG TPA: zf-HC2 domain-containing protein [Clostridiales bacterium]|nr:zf-HC2 domain-containing protein [Clostridiales bacterium]